MHLTATPSPARLFFFPFSSPIVFTDISRASSGFLAASSGGLAVDSTMGEQEVADEPWLSPEAQTQTRPLSPQLPE
jgi:hypothetical protein